MRPSPLRPARLWLSPPFGQRLAFLRNTLAWQAALGWASPVYVKGTYTNPVRRGLWWHLATTLRYSEEHGGWTNAIGLRNRRLTVRVIDRSRMQGDVVLSLGSATGPKGLVDVFAQPMALLYWTRVEVNLGCPSVAGFEPTPAWIDPIVELTKVAKRVTVKLPPRVSSSTVCALADAGVSSFHLCNTVPVTGGALSGQAVRDHALRAIRMTRSLVPGAHIVGGGGLTTVEDAEAILAAGADDLSISSAWFRPIRTVFLIRALKHKGIIY